MVKGTTKSGFKFSVDPDVISDMEFVELVAESEDNGLVFPKLIQNILGKKQKESLYEHVRNKKGRVPMDAIREELDDIFNAINSANETKNS